jgi:hypothetical protein
MCQRRRCGVEFTLLTWQIPIVFRGFAVESCGPGELGDNRKPCNRLDGDKRPNLELVFDAVAGDSDVEGTDWGSCAAAT